MTAKHLLIFTFLVYSGLQIQARTLISPRPPFVSKADTGTKNTGPIVFDKDAAAFSQGTMSLRWSSTQQLKIVRKEQEIASFDFRNTSVKPGWIPVFSRFNTAVDSKDKTVTQKTTLPLDPKNSADKGGYFSQTVKLTKDDKISIGISYKCPEARASEFKGFVSDINIPVAAAFSGTVKAGDKTFSLPDATHWNKSNKPLWDKLLQGKNINTVEFRDKSGGGFRLEIPAPVMVQIFRGSKRVMLRFNNSFNRPDGDLDMLLTFLNPGPAVSSTDCVVAGINFTQSDNLNVPVYRGTRNMMMNPAFASGTRYCRSTLFWGGFVDIDNMLKPCNEPFGKRAIILSKKTYKGFSCFGVPIHADKNYTISFYARPEGEKITTMSFKLESYSRYEKRKYFKLRPGKWTRCSYTFAIPRRQVMFTWLGEGVLVSGIQLEEGKKATGYCGNPFGVELKTDSPDGVLFQAGTEVNPRLVVRGPVNSLGKIKVSAIDFFYRKIYEHTFDFKIGADGDSVLKLPVDKLMPLGPLTIKCEVEPQGFPVYTDYLRLIKIKYARNNYKQSCIHSIGKYGCHTYLSQVPESELSLLQKLGFGSITYLAYHVKRPTAAEFDRIHKYGLNVAAVFSPNLLRAEVASSGRNDDRLIRITGKEKLGPFPLNGKLIEKVPPEFQSRLEKAFCELAKKYPFINVWKGNNEPEGSFKLLKEHNYDEYAKFVTAICKGLKRGNPQSKFLVGGSCNIGREGRETSLKVLAACQKVAPEVKLDGIEIHTYRPFPEQPDVDEDIKALLDGLEKTGYGKDFQIYFTEGAYYYPLNVPAWMGIAPWSSTTGSKDRYAAMATPTYDIGWAERLGAAMIMRYWLVCYKYASSHQIKAGTPWGVFLLDGRIPYTWMIMSGALANILGDATFKRDIRFAPGARAYVFEDREKRPVAAVWYFNENVERGKELPPSMTAAFKSKPEFLDMFGNVCSVPLKNGKYQLPLSNFPFFVRGRAGELDELCRGLQNAAVGDSTRLPLSLSARPQSKDAVEIDIVNPLTRPFDGSISLAQGKLEKLELPPKGRTRLKYIRKNIIPDNKVGDIAIPVRITQKGGKAQDSTFTFLACAANYVKPGSIKLDASIEDWQGIPSISMTGYSTDVSGGKIASPAKNNFKVNYRVAWNPQTIYLLVEVDDTAFAVDHSKKDPLYWYAKSGVQLFIDTLGDAPVKARSNVIGYDENDYSYELLPSEDGRSAVVYRRVAPDTQLTGGVFNGLMPGVLEPGVKVAFRNSGGKQVYEAEFPARYLQPLSLAGGVSFGLGIKVYDHSGKTTVKNVPAKLKLFRSPHNYPLLLLNGK